MEMAAAAPSPAAEAACFVLPARQSPAAKTPGQRRLQAGVGDYEASAVQIDQAFTRDVFGDSPMKTNTAPGCSSRCSPVFVSRMTTVSR